MVEICIEGQPVSQPRPRVTKFGTYTPKDHPVHAYRQAIAMECQRYTKLEGPVAVHVEFYIRLPKDQHRKRNPVIVKPHAKRPDIDNFLKAVFDGLADGELIADDGQISEVRAQKFYTSQDGNPRSLIRVFKLNEVT